MDPASKYNIPCRSVLLTIVCACVLLVIMLMNYRSNSWSLASSPESLPEMRYQPAHSNRTKELSCTPNQHIVFLKTHKTGSTTMTSIFQRYGYYRTLTFAVGKRHVLSYQKEFSRKNVLPFPGMKGQTFDMLVNHARYNRPEMDVVVPNATYITIIRKPEDQIDSAFGYFEMYKGMKLDSEPNPLKSFMDDPMKYYTAHNYHMWLLSRNGMLFDLGFDHKYDEDMIKILEKILELAKEFHLVLLTEYFDESLVLMKKMLCWDYEDILYLPHGIRSKSHRYEKDEELKAKLRSWSSGDVRLYDTFNRTFWNKVAKYGPTFGEDVAHFRNMNKALFEECIAGGKLDNGDKREEKYTLKNKSQECVAILRGDMGYTKLIRKSMVDRFGAES